MAAGNHGTHHSLCLPRDCLLMPCFQGGPLSCLCLLRLPVLCPQLLQLLRGACLRSFCGLQAPAPHGQGLQDLRVKRLHASWVFYMLQGPQVQQNSSFSQVGRRHPTTESYRLGGWDSVGVRAANGRSLHLMQGQLVQGNSASSSSGWTHQADMVGLWMYARATAQAWWAACDPV